MNSKRILQGGPGALVQALSGMRNLHLPAVDVPFKPQLEYTALPANMRLGENTVEELIPLRQLSQIA